jgi:hypothetical protein
VAIVVLAFTKSLALRDAFTRAYPGSLFVALAVIAQAAAATRVGWPETIEHLSQLRTQAQSCVALLKSSGDKTAIKTGRVAYESAKSEADGVIEGLVTTLVEGGKPENLPKVGVSLESASAGLKETCDLALGTIPASAGTKGVIEDVARGAIEPVIAAIASGLGALWKQHVDKDALELATKKVQLEAAKWPDFGDVAPAQ